MFAHQLRRFAGLATVRRLVAAAALVAALAASTLLVAVLQSPPFGVPNASAVYLVVVVGSGVVLGTGIAVATALAAFLLYDFLFIQPLYTLTVASFGEWLNLLLLLLVGVTIGRLTALQARRANEAERRLRESQAQFEISRLLAFAGPLEKAIPAILGRLTGDARMDRLWFTVRPGDRERTVGDTGPGGDPVPDTRTVTMLARTAGDLPARWVRAHGAVAPATRQPARPGQSVYRVRIEADGEHLGDLWAVRPRDRGLPDREATRLLAFAADQLGLALTRERLAREALASEVARQSDALKSALLASVSHDMRAPLASIRAAAGTLLDREVHLTSGELQETAATIDLEAERLDRIVRNLLDLSRIEGGALHPELEIHDLAAIVDPVLDRLRTALGGFRVRVSLPDDLPPVLVDAVFLDDVLTNLLENAARYAGPAADIAISSTVPRQGRVEIVIEDSGQGVPTDALPHLFDKFYRVPRPAEGARRGLGLGLSVVKGLVEAMGGDVVAARSPLGGLAVRLTVPATPPLPDDAPDTLAARAPSGAGGRS